MFHADKDILLLSRREEDAVLLLGKVIYAYDALPEWMKLRAGDGRKQARTDTGVEKMVFSNGSKIRSLPATGDTGRGEAASLVVADEWAFFPDPERTWAALEPTTDVGGDMVLVSTANGVGNTFHEMWVKAESGDSIFSSRFYDWRALPGRDEAWYRGKKATLPEWQLAQEYPQTPDEAFVKSARPYFDVDLLKNWNVVKPSDRYIIDHNRLLWGRIDGELKVWQPPGDQEPHPKQNATYVIGADIAEGLAHGDFSSAHVIHVQTGDVVAAWHGRIDPDLFGSQILYGLGQHFNMALIGPERNSSGLTTVTALVREKYPYIYRQQRFDTSTQQMMDKFGWQTTRVSRPYMLDALAEAIREKSIHVFDEATRQELMGFVRDDKGRGSGSPHDDRVMSLAIAVQMLQHAHSPEYQAQRVEYGTLAWYFEKYMKPVPTDAALIVGNERVGRHSG